VIKREMLKKIFVKLLKERAMTEPLILEVFSDYV